MTTPLPATEPGGLWAPRVLQVVRAPAPRRIRIDCQVNASASFRRARVSSSAR